MMRTYGHHGFTLEVSVESDFTFRPVDRTAMHAGYVAVVRVLQAGHVVATFSPLRYGDVAGRPFNTEVDALTGGHDAASKIVDELFSQSQWPDPGRSVPVGRQRDDVATELPPPRAQL
ncbi:hypothetical protein [Burkholderia stagnalis]|uniref:hypothetical protein n=1 Tax=Burkholderia stagnalis TaxID=1503054 RepID=UPI0007C7BBA0|nr:hypothetical protein [Burkholderia stagnalis]